MTIAQEDAASALASVARTRRRSIELSGYAHAGDLVLAWGLVWLACNLATQFFPWGMNSWAVGILLASAFCVVRGRSAPKRQANDDWRIYASIGTAIGFLILVIVIAGLDDPRQTNALISLFIAANYVAMGVWTGPRFAWTGLFIAAVVIVAWFFDRADFYLWMALAGGGALIVTGLWLRRA